MNRPTRIGLAFGFLAAVGGFLAFIAHDPSHAAASDATGQPGPAGASTSSNPPPRFNSSQECAECHAEVYAEWKGSHHQIAYLNPEVRKLSDDFRNKECQACHLPRPVADTGLVARTLPRITRPEEGVDCLACHLGQGGRILGTRTSDRGCQPIADPRAMGVELCQTCHNQHGTTDQWRASKFAAEGTDCMTCHMAEVKRVGGRKGRGHVYPGAHDAATLKKGGLLRMKVEGGNVALEFENSAAGHNYPTEERHRAIDIVVRFTTPSGVSEWQLVSRFRQPYRDEPGENTQVPAGEKRSSTVAIPEGATRVESRLWYRLNPFAVDDDAASTLLYELAEDIK